MSKQSKPEGVKAAGVAESCPVTLLPNQIDRDFKELIKFIRQYDFQEVREAIIRNLKYFSVNNYTLYRNSINFMNEHKLWGTYYPEMENYELADNRAHALTEHLEDFEWIYNNLGDNRSKKILVNILYYWLMSDNNRIEQIYDRTFSQYFDLDLVKCSKEEVFVDIGGYTGDTLASYARTFGQKTYKRLYCYEIVPADIEYIEENIKRLQLDNVVLRKKGASSKSGTMYLTDNVLSSVSHLYESGTIAVPVVKIDDDIEEDVTFIKMDIEGAEEDALLGCLEKIRQNHPKLALSIYHNHKDMWKLARIIYEVDPSYKFYIRYYGSAILPTEYILYAI